MGDQKKPKKLLEQARDIFRAKYYSYRTEQSYIAWMRKYIFFHGRKHPKDLGAADIEAFLTHLAVTENVAPSTQNQAFNALLFLYREVLGISLADEKISALRAKKKKNIPIALSVSEVKKVLALLQVTQKIMARLIYGGGLRLMECVRLRVHDIDFAMNEIVVRNGKGSKDRLTILPESVKKDLEEQIERVRIIHAKDLKNGFGSVYLPYGLERKFRNAHRELGWQFLFPAAGIAADPRSRMKRRHHIHETTVQKAVKQAAGRAGINKRVTPHTLRH